MAQTPSENKPAPKRTRKTKVNNETAPPVEQVLPPGGLQPVIPPVQQFVGVYSAGNRFFKNADEAYLSSRENAWRMWFDLSIQDPLQSRILATAQLPWAIEPEDKRDPVQVERAREVQRIVEDIPGLLKLKVALLHAVWFGKYAVQTEYEWGFNKAGRKVLRVKNWSPVHGDSIYFKWDKPDEVGVLVGPMMGEGTRTLTTQPTDQGLAHVLTPWEREAFCIHTHLHLSNDWHKLEKAGQVKGVGLRDTIYWTWWLKNECMGMLQEFLERVGTGMTIWRYDGSNPQSLAAVKEVAESQTSNCQIFFPYTEEEKAIGGAVQRIEPSSVGLDNFMRIIDDYFGGQIKRVIAGQSLTSEAHATGLGSSLSEVHENTFMRLVKLDAVNLGETLTHQLVRVIHKYSYPEDSFRLKYVSSVDRPDPEKYLVAAEKFQAMGGTLDEDEVRSVLGFTKPDADSTILGGQQPGGVPGAGLPPGVDQEDVLGAQDGEPTGDEGDELPPGDTAAGEGDGDEPVGDEQAADEIAHLLTEVYGALGVGDVQIDRLAILEKIASKPQAATKYRAVRPPWPGAVFDEQKHRWVSGDRDQPGAGTKPGAGGKPASSTPNPKASPKSGAPAQVPGDQETWQEVYADLAPEFPELAEPETAKKAEKVASDLKLKIYGWLFRLSPGVQAVAEAVLDTPEDMMKFGYNPTALGTHHEMADPIRSATGLSTHLAMSIASKVLAAGYVAVKNRVVKKSAAPGGANTYVPGLAVKKRKGRVATPVVQFNRAAKPAAKRSPARR